VPTPVPPDTVRVNTVWALPGDEIAVNSLHFHHEHAPGNDLDWANDMTQRYANLVRDAWVSVRTNLQTAFGPGVSLQRTDAYHLAVEGNTLDKATALFEGTNAWVGTGEKLMPLQNSVAVSLFGYDPAKYDPQGARKRGRIYLPGLAQSMCTNTGRVASIQSLSANIALVLSYCQGRTMDSDPIVDPERARLVVLSRAGVSYSPVVAVRVDDLWDVQKRRQNNLVAARQVAALNPQDD
jgi:hypothetical protein